MGHLYRQITRDKKDRMVQQMRIRSREEKGKKAGKNRWRLLTAAVLLIVSAFLMVLAARHPGFAEWYSETIYPLFVEGIGRMWGAFPFSVSELALYGLILVFVLTAVVTAARIIQIITAAEKGSAGRMGRDRAAQFFVSWLSAVLIVAGILAFLYTVCCGINYHRKSFSEEEGIITYHYSVEELKEICLWLTEEVNSLAGGTRGGGSSLIKRDENGAMMLDAPEGEGAVAAMESLAEQFPTLKGYYPQPKKLLVSQILSYQGLTGVYSPFTVEANYNGDMTAYNIPFTTCHELSHLRGFMQEEEANFIAFLACIGSERPDFQYSGYLSGWVYCMNALYRSDYDTWQEVRPLLAEEAEPDLAADRAFWDSYEGKISEAADRVNDTYLKVNGQVDGVQSYNRMVDLIVAYFGE